MLGIVCGKCHDIGTHTKRSCPNGTCKSVKSCGLIEKHEIQKELRKMDADIVKAESEIRIKQKEIDDKMNEWYLTTHRHQ